MAGKEAMSRVVMKHGAALLLAGAMLTSTVFAETIGKVPAQADSAALVEHAAEPSSEKAADTNWQLLLVNPWNALPEEFTVELASLKNGMRVDARIYEELNDMLSDCLAEGLHPIVCSAYRTQATQSRLYNNKVARLRAVGYKKEEAQTEAGRWVAVPGTSEHQTGLALDIVASSYQILDEKQEQTAEQQWLMENSWRYGFILRYPSDKGKITGIGYEPWHYRYVGKEAAAAMHESGQCLEEYLQTPIQEGEGAPTEERTESDVALPETMPSQGMTQKEEPFAGSD
jgi:D-alanyl-D-alanine carboxypeptidase